MGISLNWQVVFPTSELEDSLETLKILFPKLAGRFRLPSGDLVEIGETDESAEPTVLSGNGWGEQIELRVEIDSYIRELWDGPDPLPPEPTGFDDGDSEEEDDDPGWDEEDEDDDEEDEETEAWESGFRRAQEDYDKDEDEDWYDDEEDDDSKEDELEDTHTPYANLYVELDLEVDSAWSRITIGSDIRTTATILTGSPNVREVVKGLASRIDGTLLENGDFGPSVHESNVQIPQVDFPESESIDELGEFLHERLSE